MIAHSDLHIHTQASDGRAHPREVVSHARVIGLNVIAITDHNTFAGAVLARKYASKSPLVIAGAEVRTVWGDVLLLCRDPIPITKDPRTLRDLADANGCVLIPAHPFDVMRLGIGWRVRENLWDCIECFNMGSDPITNAMAWIYCRASGKPCIACSDAHVIEMVGVARTLIEVADLTPDDVLESLRKGLVNPRPRYTVVGLAEKVTWGLQRKLHGHTRYPTLSEDLYLRPAIMTGWKQHAAVMLKPCKRSRTGRKP